MWESNCTAERGHSPERQSPAVRFVRSVLTTLSVICGVAVHLAMAGQNDFSLSKLAVPGEVLGLVPADLDADSLQDLVIFHKKGLPPQESRWVSVFWQGANGTFGTAPDQTWELDTLATVADVGNIDTDPKLEICYLTSKDVRYYKLDGRRYSERNSELFPCTTLTVFPSRSQLPIADFVRDWDERPGDEVAVFDFNGLAIHRPDPHGHFSPGSVMRIDLQTHLRTSPVETDRDRISGVEASFVFPDITIADYNGDKSADIIATLEDRLQIYPQSAEGVFSREPAASIAFDVRTEEEKQQENSELRTVVADLNKDGFADAVVSKMTAKGLSSFRSVLSIFWGRSIGYAKIPDQVLISEGSASATMAIRDVNGDGCLDLVVPSLRLSIVAIIRILITRNVPVTFNIFLCHDGQRYSDRPDFEKEVNFKVDLSGESDTQAMTLDGDFDGDKINDFVLATGDDELSIFLGAQSNDKDLFSRKPASEITADAFGDLISLDLNHDGYSDMILHYPNTKDRKGLVEVLINRKTVSGATH